MVLVRGHPKHIAMLRVLDGDGGGGTATFVPIANVGKVFGQSAPGGCQTGIVAVGNYMRPLHRLFKQQKDQRLVQSANKPLILVKPGFTHSVNDV